MSAMVLTGGTVVTSLSPPRVERANVGVAGGRVVELTPARLSGHPQVDCAGCLIMPGMVCAHHHLYSSLARGMPYTLAPPRSFLEILSRIWWRLDRALDRRSVWWSATAGGAEALLAGTTTIVDHHSSPNAVEESLSEVGGALGHLGARAVLAYEVTDREGPGGAASGLKEVRRFEEGRGELSPGGALLRTMVGAHASFTLGDDTLGACVDAARDLGVGIHLHVAEDDVDQRDAQARFGKRVVTRLADAGVLKDAALLAHCIHLDDDELEAVQTAGATAVHNPRSNMNNGVGRMRVAEFDRLALGTDGIGGDMFAEAQAGYWRTREEEPGLQPQWALDRLAESARFAGAAFDEPLLGRIEPGAPADLIVLDASSPTPLTADNLAGHYVFGLSSRHVRDVFVAGEGVVRDRRLARIDEDELRTRSREVAEDLWARMEVVPEHPFAPEGSGRS